MKGIPRVVWILCFISFLTDVSSELIYPLLPLFIVADLGGGTAILGIMEGIAELISALFKIYSGSWSDRLGRTKPFVLCGYSLSGIARSLIGLAGHWGIVLGLRSLDRVGKGLRTAPRDAMIAGSVAPNRRGAAFGLHRSMDHAGAMLGPLLATVLLGYFHLSVREVIQFAAVPAAVTLVLLAFLGRGEANPPVPKSVTFLQHPNYRKFLVAIGVFALGNSSDIFLLVLLGKHITTAQLTTLWALHSGIRMLSNYFWGRKMDHLPVARVLAVGWFLFSLCYFGFAHLTSSLGLSVTFLFYGIVFGLIEPSERLLVTRMCGAESMGKGFGMFHFVSGVGALIASVTTGILWNKYGHKVALSVSAALVLIGVIRLYADFWGHLKRGN